MNREWLIIPEISELQEYVKLAQEYNAAFEYNDFFDSSVYQNEDEIKRRIDIYKSIDRDRSRDTLHGPFIDLVPASSDEVIRDRSRSLMELAMDIAKDLGCRGVVFHTGLVGELRMERYLNHWVEEMTVYFMRLSKMNPGISIYIENTFDKEPTALCRLMNNLPDYPDIKLCMDYSHAILTPYDIEDWVKDMAPHIGHMHINDNNLINDLHMQIGAGNINFAEYAMLMERYKVNVPTLIEMNGIKKQRESLEYLRGLA